MRICEIAFHAFFDDTRQLVTDGVKNDIKRRIAAASTDDEREAALARGDDRNDALKDWLRMRFPLAYGEPGRPAHEHKTFRLLLRAVSEDKGVAAFGLRGWEDNSMTMTSFVDALIEMSTPEDPKLPYAPVMKAGGFLPVLKVAHASILDIGSIHGVTSKQTFLKKMLLLALKVFHVKFFPSHAKQTGLRGAPKKVPVFHSWGHLGVKDTASTSLFLPDPDPSASFLIEPETIAYNNAVANDCTAPWEMAHDDLGIKISNIKLYLNRTTLPNDFGVVSETHVEYVDESYKWVIKFYDGTKRVHHLALLVSMIASCFMPELFPTLKSKGLFNKSNTREDVRKIYNNMPWVTRKDRKGVTEKPIFIAMLTTFIIGLYEESVPLSQRVKKFRGLGESWTNKYSGFGFLRRRRRGMQFLTSFQRRKGSHTRY